MSAVIQGFVGSGREPDCEEEEDNDSARVRSRKKPWRYRWPDPFRDEVLARLLDLNAQRAQAERLAGAAPSGKKGASKGKRTSQGAKLRDAEPLLGETPDP